jgi:hypothetical protein
MYVPQYTGTLVYLAYVTLTVTLLFLLVLNVYFFWIFWGKAQEHRAALKEAHAWREAFMDVVGGVMRAKGETEEKVWANFARYNPPEVVRQFRPKLPISSCAFGMGMDDNDEDDAKGRPKEAEVMGRHPAHAVGQAQPDIGGVGHLDRPRPRG